MDRFRYSTALIRNKPLKTIDTLNPTASESWQQQLNHAFSQVDALCHYLNIDMDSLPELQANASFPVKVPRCFADCMEPGNPDDPLLKQVLPLQEENIAVAGFVSDPVGDLAAMAEAGLIHKYQGRALLITTAACAIHCRYCFRRNFPYSDNQITPQKRHRALDYIAHHSELEEIILSGGDPLLLSDNKLEQLLENLQKIPHIKRIRLHSRLPVVLPARITPHLVQLLASGPQKTILVLHANHPNELSAQVAVACQQLKPRNITLLNQSVLLKGVNDCADTLYALSERLFECDILPYYLHQLDPAQGTAHFAISDSKALSLYHQIQSRLPGYLVPKLVREIAGAAYKIPLMR